MVVVVVHRHGCRRAHAGHLRHRPGKRRSDSHNEGKHSKIPDWKSANVVLSFEKVSEINLHG
jgi:hypothetical protein